MDKEIKKFYEMLNYDPFIGKEIMTESMGDENMEGWLNIGVIKNGAVMFSNGGDAYLMADPNYESYGENYKRLGTGYNTKPDGSGRNISSMPTYMLQDLVIYDDYKDTFYGEVFLGKKDEKDLLKHKAFMDQLIEENGGYLIYHDSNVKITDGYINYGKKNSWPKDSDVGIYFWGSKIKGIDNSNNGKYTYYCIIPKSSLYDFENNLERLTIQQALKKYDYVAQYWDDGKSIVVNTYKPTKISFVKENR